MEMTVTDFFGWQKSKRLRVAFALYSPAEDDLPPEVGKFYVDFADLEHPIAAYWRPHGLVSVQKTSFTDYQENWGEFVRQCDTARRNTIGWDEEKARCQVALSRAVEKNEKRFWTAVLDTLNFYQIDTRIY